MIAEFTGALGVFDAEAVTSLTGHPDDAAFAAVFVGSYRRMLPERVGRIEASLRGDDLDEARDAALSLKAASATVGTGELAGLAERIGEHLRQGDLAAARDDADLLPDAARRADHALAAFLQR
ncbi:MAG: Hpt domain-containing protein [Nocardioides sp.]